MAGKLFGYYGGMLLALEIFFIALLVITAITIAWFAGYVVFRLVKGQA